MDLSVVIPARNEEFLGLTIDRVLDKAKAKTEVIAILDGYWPNPPIVDRDNLTLIHHVNPVGQRAGVNEGVRLSNAKYVMKLDAHCDVDEGFDVKLMEDIEPDWTVIPRMYNLHGFDWKCKGCGWRKYQGPIPEKCEKCDFTEFEKDIVWKKRDRRFTDFWMFDSDLKFQYWKAFKKRPEAKEPIVDVMSNIGACFFMERERYLYLEGLDEGHGSWGQVGTEVACKSWLSGGRHVVNKKTWFAHMFRTQSGFKFPYPISWKDQEAARKYSRHLWNGNNWHKQKRKLSWLVTKFAPVPTWDEPGMTALYYTANKLDENIAGMVRKKHLEVIGDIPLISISQKPIDFGENICVGDIGQSLQNVYRQILEGAKKATTQFVVMLEDDCLYTPEHFKFEPKPDTFAYNGSRWNYKVKKPIFFCRVRPVMSQCIAPRRLLIDTLEARLALKEIPDKYCGEPGLYEKKLGLPEVKYERFFTESPNVVLCHDNDTSGSKIITKETKEEIPYWGRADKLLEKVSEEIEVVDPYQRLGYRRQSCKITGKPDFSVQELWDHRFGIVEPGKKSLVDFYPAFEDFIGQLVEGKKFTDDELRDHPYHAYLCTKLHPADRVPEYTQKGLRHVFNKMKNAIELFESIRDEGLKAPLVFFRYKGAIRIIRGARRLVILHKLGVKHCTIRVFSERNDVRRYDPVPDKLHKVEVDPKSMHGIAIKHHKKLGGRGTSDKYWIHDYLRIYDKEFGHLRNQHIKILELGLLYGASLKIWHEAFPRAMVYGVDKNYSLWKKYTKGLDRIKVFVGMQQDKEFLEKEVVPSGPFNVIIDDCGHVPKSQLASFDVLFPALKSHGYYVIEDCHHSYNSNYRKKKGFNFPMHLTRFIGDLYLSGKILSVQFYYNLCIIQKGL